MAFNRKKGVETENENKRPATDYYKLNTKAVDDLVTADESNSPEMTPEDLKKYGQKKFIVPEWLKAVLIKAWFAGAVCFFVFMGLGMQIPNMLDMLFVFGVALGIVTDLLVNNIFRFYEKRPGANDKWMMCPRKNFLNFFLNIVYACILLVAVFFVHNGIAALIVSITDLEKFPVEPISFGLLYMGVDMLFLGMKHTFEKIVDDAEKKVKKESAGKK